MQEVCFILFFFSPKRIICNHFETYPTIKQCGFRLIFEECEVEVLIPVETKTTTHEL